MNWFVRIRLLKDRNVVVYFLTKWSVSGTSEKYSSFLKCKK